MDNSQVLEFMAGWESCVPKSSLIGNFADEHQRRVTAFCETCSMHTDKQRVSHTVDVGITKEQAVLRAVLQLEECLEMIRGLGVEVMVHPDYVDSDLTQEKAEKAFEFAATGQFNLKEIIDGAVDSSVIANGTASMFGIPLAPFYAAIDHNNIAKFGPGHTIRQDGKLVKPEGHPAPDMDGVLESISGQTFEGFTFNWSDR